MFWEEQMKKYREYICIVILTICAIFALATVGNVTEDAGLFKMLRTQISGLSAASSVVSIILVVFAPKIWSTIRSKGCVLTHVLSAIFAIFMLVGISFTKNGDMSFVYYSKKQFLIALIVFIGYTYIFDYIICILYGWLECRIKEMKPMGDVKWISRHFQLASFAAIMLAWLPYYIVFWPGSVPHDGYYQINMAFGINPMSNHHPYLLSYFMGALVAVGRLISDNFGIFLCVTVMGVIEALCFSRICSIISMWSSKLAYISTVFFMLVPMWGAYAEAVIKDTLFSALFAVFVAETLRIYADVRRGIPVSGLRSAILLFVLGICSCITRNNGVYMCIPQLIVLALLLVRYRARTKRLYMYIIGCLLMVAGVYAFTQGPLMARLNVSQTSAREALSIPVQQTARYVKYYGDDVSEEEKEAISKVLPYDQLAELYNPDLSDPVKFKFGTVQSETTNEDVKEYFAAWFSMLQKHPGVYVEATLAGSYAYFYPFTWRDALGTYQFYIKGGPVATGDFDFHYVFSDSIRNKVSEYADAWKYIPLLCLTITPASYTWVLLLYIGFFFYVRRGRRSSLLLVGAALNVAVCMASPVNGLPRYATPLMACIPCIIAFAMIMVRKADMTENKDDIVSDDPII